MISINPWAKMPTDWITDEKIKKFRFAEDGSTATAALLLFFVLCQTSTEHVLEENASMEVVRVATLTYDDMEKWASLSRAKVALGLKRLLDLKMISRIGTNRAGAYKVEGFEKGKRWAKLPGQALLSPAKTQFLPFTRFMLRSRHEVNALKLHLYYASVRNKIHPHSEVSYETIFEKTGVAERDIPSANSLLLSTGLMHMIGRDKNEDVKQYAANRYFMTGYKHLFILPKAE
ncbi:hypothetical protein AAKU55_005767 [Oxalobacteraceae bacterium GrIS 1.11]